MSDVSLRKCLPIVVALFAILCATASGQVAGPSQMDQCAQDTVTITVANTSETESACDIVVTATLPEPGFTFVDDEAFVTLHSSPDPIAADPVDSAWDIDAIVGSDYELPPGEELTVTFVIATDCTAESGNIEIQIDYADCGTAQPYQEFDSLSIEIRPGALIVSKTPSVQDARVGDEVTWTITVESTGLGTVSNVVLSDVLGPGLAYISDTGGGSNVGQTTTWDLGDIAEGASVSVDLTAEVISCSGLYNDADASWGCASPQSTCFDTAVNAGTATASLNLIVDDPDLVFIAPEIVVPYCSSSTQVVIPITNEGDGAARNVELCVDLPNLSVTNVQGGASFDGGCFQIPDIPPVSEEPANVFNLTFDVVYAGDWCTGGPSGTDIFELTYTNDCDIPFVAYPQFSTISSGAGPALAVTKTGPDALRLGETGDYNITVDYAGDLSCYGGAPDPVDIVDTYPEGFTVIEPAGGTVDGGARTITWSNTTLPFDETIQLQAPTDCGYCAQPGGGSHENEVSVTTTDCCGCTLTGEASAVTAIHCEGFGGTEYFSSSMSVDRTTTVRCSEDYAATVTHTYTFIDDPALDDFLLNEFTYFVDLGAEWAYSPGTASVTGATIDTVTTPGSRLEIRLADATTVRGPKTIVYEYTLIAQDLGFASCQATVYSIDAGVEIDPGATAIGFCGTMYADPPSETVTAEPPSMSVTIGDIPTIQEYCATYDVTITLRRTSELAKPYDARVVLTNNGGSILDMSQATCGGTVSPTDGTTCTAPIEGANSYEWRFADLFDADTDVATITFPITVPCSGPLADLSVVATFDDLCHDDTSYDDTCSTSGSDEASLSLSSDVYTRKSPEILYATTKYVEWSIVVQNTGNGTAYNVWVDDVLGSGLIFDEGNTDPVGATVSANLDHTGTSINGASFLFDEVASGELKTITFAAELVDCDNLTNDIAVSWGCGGSDCQPPRTDSSSVVIPPVNLVATSYAPTPLDVCTTSWAELTVKNAGVGTVYNVTANVTLPAGLEYTGNPEYRTYVFGETPGSFLPTVDPTGVPGPSLVWTSEQIGDLASVDPNVVVEIRFDVAVGCDFPGGDLLFQSGYESPCGEPYDSNVGSFSIAARVPDVSVEMVQAPDDAIPCGASATWTITVRNDGPVSAPYIRIVSTLDAGWAYVSSTGGGSNVGQITTWEIVDLGPSASTAFTITADSAAAGAGTCDDLNHQMEAFWACDETDTQCLSSATDTAFVAAARTPPVTVGTTLAPDSVEVCTDSTTFTLTIANGSATAPASYIDARVTLPAGLSYVLGTTEIDCGSGYVPSPDPAIDGQQLTWYDTAVDGGADDACATIAAGGQIQIRFDVASSCYFTAGSANSRIFYYDCCGVTQAQQSRNDTIGSDQPNLTITKTTVDEPTCSETATWTIEVMNTSADGIAEVIRIEDFLGANLSFVSATGGAIALSGGQILYPTPPAYGAAYGWELGPLGPGASTSVTLTAELAAPADCTDALRTNTAVVTWACGTPDGDPTTADYDCESNEWDDASDRVAMPNLEVDPSDITPVFGCSGDGIDPGAQIEIVVRNTGDRQIVNDFTISVTETTTGYSVTDTFTNLGGSLPLAAGGSDMLTFPWAVACSSCSYTINVTLDTLDDVCECDETDNAAILSETITLPDLTVDSADLAVICAGDGQIRVQGPVTLRNDGCGDPVTDDLRLRVSLYDDAVCGGTELDAFTLTWTGVDLASGGGTLERTIDELRPLDVCAVTQVSVLIVVDDNDQICECSGDNNDLCVGPFALALPDLAITDTTVNVPNACDVGSIDVTIENTGSGAAPAGIVVRITGDATGEATTPGLSAGASTVVTVPFDAPIDCGPQSITVTVDPDDVLCECSDGSNTTDVGFTVSDPDLVIGDLVAACQPDGTIRVTATVSNDGDEISGNVTLRVLLDGSPIDTSVISLDPTESLPIDLTTDPVECGVEHTIRVDVDADDEVCECDETNNSQEAAATCPCPALSVDKIITDILRDGSSIGTTGPIEPGDVVFYRYTITNVAAGTAFNVDFTDVLPTGLVTETDAPGDAGSYVVSDPVASGSLSLADGVGTFTTSIGVTIAGGETLVADYTVIATSDIEQGTDLINVAATTGETADGTPIPGENPGLGDTSDGDSEDPDADDTGITVLGTAVPALSVDKTITDIVRPGVGSLGIAGPVEPGDIVFYRFVITNVGDGTAYGVEFTDTLPTGLVVETDAPGDSGSFSVSDPAASGSLNLTDGAGAFTTSIDATIDGGETLTADFAALVTSGIIQGVDLVNTAEATGVDGFGTEIPDENPAAGDTSDGDAEDPDADDTGIAVIPTEEPALSVDKIITDIQRRGSSIGPDGPVEPGDVVFYRYTIRNVGLGTAYGVNFTDMLPTGLVTEADAPGDAGSWTVDDPTASGSLGVPDNVGVFTTSISATIAGGGELIADYSVHVTSDIEQGTDLINIAAATGVDGAGNPIPEENADVGDTSDDDEEDPDADDTGITVVAPVVPALTIDKRVIDVLRNGTSIGVVDPVLYGDVIVYRTTIRNVGLGTAYDVEFNDTLPTGLAIETGEAPGAGSYEVTSPSASGSLALSDGASTFTTSIDATIDGGETLTATYAAIVTPAAPPAFDLVNTAETAGEDGAGTEIPDENADVGDTSDDDEEDPDADDTGIASVRVGAPALVTRKTVASIRRQGIAVDGDVVEPGDIVTYEVGVTNVGDGPAFRIDLFDELPAGFLYDGGTEATWPSGASTADPLGAPGPLLTWLLEANLKADEELVLRFEALVTSDIVQGTTYTNTVTATGEDGAGEEIPPDNSEAVPDDNDPDDTSDVSLIGAVPALVTDKSILSISRDGRSLGAVETIEAGDVITYALRITNVGLGTAYDVDVRDFLPTAFEYVDGTTEADWPFRLGTYSNDPTGTPGPSLTWDTDAILETDDSIVLTFDALVAEAVAAGERYTNELYATGRDGANEEIPANNADDVIEDDDPDDRDTVTVIAIVEAPALVTSKRVTDLLRDGASTSDRVIEEGDVVRFELTVRNVGPATAYHVGIDDRLPVEFEYVSGSTRAAWPRGSASSDPSPGGEGLVWRLDATLTSGDLLVLSFDARASGPLYDGTLYTNRMHAFGEDAAGEPIPEDQREIVPSDTDPDDASDVSLTARSAFIEGEGGLIAVPILRKRAEVLGEATCTGWIASVDRIWYQTDIAMFAATELESLEDAPSDWALLSETLLPSWLRTVQAQGAFYARDNLLQADVLSSIGVRLTDGPRIERRAAERGITREDALTERLDMLAEWAGLEPEDRPSNERWIFLEFAEGEPRYVTSNDTILGPAGDWTIVDERIVGSALGMGLLKQATAAEDLLASESAIDRYLGSVLVEAMANKVLALDDSLTVREAGVAPFIPHVHRWIDGQASLETEDAETDLFDQFSLLWGLSQSLEFAEGLPPAWSEDESEIQTVLLETGLRLLGEVLAAVEDRHVAPTGELIDRSDETGRPASTVDLGLLLVALDAARGVASDHQSAIDRLFAVAVDQLVGRQADEGRFATSTDGPLGHQDLATQLAGIRGLLIAHGWTDDERHADRAHDVFDGLDESLWEERGGIGLYASARFGDARSYCYTPLEIGLAVGALRELANISSPDRRTRILDRLSRFVRAIVDEAALQLSNTHPIDARFTTAHEGIAPIDGGVERLAPVLQQRLCLEDAMSDEPCAGWHALPHDPWYQTDIAMYAAYTIQDRIPALEDYADANLVAVDIHSRLGVPFRAIPSLQASLDNLPNLEPIALPYASGSPRLPNAPELAWDEATFDDRIVASALGMTLLREAQEVLQSLDAPNDDPDREVEISILAASILEKLRALSDIRIEKSDGAYIPHASRWVGTDDRLTVIDETCSLFDQAALLWGLNEAHGLLADSRAASLIGPSPGDQLAYDLLVTVLSTLETALLDSDARTLVDSAAPTDEAWTRSRTVSTVNLGLTASALGHVIEAFGTTSPIGERAYALLDRIVGFVETDLWRSVGEYIEAVDLDEDPGIAACETETLAGQLGALRVLVAAERHLGGSAACVADAVRSIDARFWDPDLRVYWSEPERIEGCITPLDLGLSIDTIDRAANHLTPTEAVTIRDRLLRHADRILDGAAMQIPSELRDDVRFAPVFDRQICLRPIGLVGETGWAQAGDLVRYTVTAENATDETFIDLLLEDTLPEGVTLISTDPVGPAENGTVAWAFESLVPEEKRIWQLLVRVDETAALGDELLNCAVLTYSDLEGEIQPPREACAAAEIRTLDDGLQGLLRDAPVWYVTDEAMHLSAVIESLACREAGDWDRTTAAHGLATSNLGTLLGSSALGVPLDAAPRLMTTGTRDDTLATILEAFAARAGLPGVPSLGTPIFLPYEAGVPLFEDRMGFTDRSDLITPAALGWTLAEETRFLAACPGEPSGLAAYLRSLTTYVVENQVEWLSTILLSGGEAHLPHGIQATIVEENVVYGVSDPRSLVYDQASLLLGLLRVVEAEGLDRRTRLLAQQLASTVFERLALHWVDGSDIPTDILFGDVESGTADWADLAVVARALDASVDILSRHRGEVETRLAGLARATLDRGRIAQPTGEAGRLTVLLIASRSLDDADFRSAFLESWSIFKRIEYSDVGPGLRSRQDWSQTPGELATRLALLNEIARTIPEERVAALRAATLHLDRDIVAARVQLVAPQGVWSVHSRAACFGFAPVFVHLRGALPELP